MHWQQLLSPVLLPWFGLLYKLPALRRNPHSVTLRTLCLAFFALGTALVLLLPPVYRWAGTMTGVPHLARLLAHSFGLLNGWALQLLLLHLTHDGERARYAARMRHLIFAGALTVVVVLFWRAPVESASADFLSTYADRPQIAAYLTVYLLYVGYSLFDIGSLSARYSRQARSGPLRTGLRLVAIGSLVGLLALRAYREPARADAEDTGGDHLRDRAAARRQARADAIAVHTALSRRHTDRPVGGNSTIIAAPTDADLLAEGRQLAMVSRALDRLIREDGRARLRLRGTDTPTTPDREHAGTGVGAHRRPTRGRHPVRKAVMSSGEEPA